MNILRLYLSASRDLRQECNRVAVFLQQMGMQVVTHETFGPSSGSLIELIKNQIEASDGFIQLVGFDAGAAPPKRETDQIGEAGTYVQIEGKLARRLGKPTYLFFADNSLKRDSISPDSAASMEEYRQYLGGLGSSRHLFSTAEGIMIQIRHIDLMNWLAKGRQQSGFRIFLSYRRQELISKCVAHRLYEGMAKTFGNDHIFLDAHSIPLGQDYREYLDSSVARANFMCVVIGPEWVSTLQNRLNDPKDYVRWEIESAFRLRIPVSPILIEDTKLPTETQIPESLHQIIVSQGLRIRIGSELYNDIHDLNQRIRSLAPEPTQRINHETEKNLST